MKNLFILSLFALLLTSCSDYLVEENKKYLTAEEYYMTPAGLESSLNACYGHMRDIYGGDPDLFEAGTDLIATGRNTPALLGLTNYKDLNPSSASTTIRPFYLLMYTAIRTCNTTIYFAQKQGGKEDVVAQAQFLRGLYYFQLLQQFGGVALVKEMLTEPEYSFTRASAQETYDFIIADMEASLNSGKLPATAADGRVNAAAVNHFLSKVYLSRSYETFGNKTDDANKAITYASAAISSMGQTSLTLSFKDLFWPKQDVSKEVMFSVQFLNTSLSSETDGGNRQHAFFGPYLGGGETLGGAPYQTSTLAPTARQYDLFTSDDDRYYNTFMTELYGDPVVNANVKYYDYYTKYASRTSLQVAFFYPPKWFTTADIEAWKAVNPAMRNAANIREYSGWAIPGADRNFPCVLKFSDPNAKWDDSGRTSTRPVFLARLAETFLLRAEANIQLGNTAAAATDINVVRARAKVAPITSAEATIDFLLDERGREFVGEYMRWFDLRRTGKLVEYASTYNDNVKLAGGTAAFVGPDGNNKILRPIPQAIIDLNQAPVTQNPGY